MMQGVLLSALKVLPGEAGSVLHGLRKSWDGFAGFGEVYFSEIHLGAIKSWRRHLRGYSNLIVPVGAVRFVVHDGRAFEEFRIGRDADYARLAVAPGLWFAFQGIGTGTSLIVSVSNIEHDPTESETRPLDGIAYPW
jgi:dTDP-4-dehydrorhamnose 3,5-epimerase